MRILKKVKSAGLRRPTRKQQTDIVYDLTQIGFKLKDVLYVTELPESTYHYHIAKKTKPHKDKELEDLIQAIFEEHKERYGYRRITIELRARGYKVNHKRVLRIMRQLGLQCLKFTNRSRRYNSYKGPVGKVAKNKINRRFMTPHPLQKLVTDITEFKCLNDEKLYLSPIMDLYNQALVLHKTENHCYLFIVN